MERQIVLKKRYINNLLKVLNYLQAEWGEKVTAEFIARLDKRMLNLLSQPKMGMQSEVVKEVRGILITKHNRVFYKIASTKIIILDIKDTRMNPKRNPYKSN